MQENKSDKRLDSSGDRQSSYRMTILEEDESISRSSMSLLKQKKDKEFVPFLNERSKNGRIHIESVKNLITKKG